MRFMCTMLNGYMYACIQYYDTIVWYSSDMLYDMMQYAMMRYDMVIHTRMCVYVCMYIYIYMYIHT